MKPTITKQGLAVIEESDGEWLLMTPDGNVSVHLSQQRAQKAADRWFRSQKIDPNSIAIGLTEIRQ